MLGKTDPSTAYRMFNFLIYSIKFVITDQYADVFEVFNLYDGSKYVPSRISFQFQIIASFKERFILSFRLTLRSKKKYLFLNGNDLSI